MDGNLPISPETQMEWEFHVRPAEAGRTYRVEAVMALALVQGVDQLVKL